MIDDLEDRANRTTFARETSKTLHVSSIEEIIRFFRSSAHYLDGAEQIRLNRCADDLEEILKWQDQ